MEKISNEELQRQAMAAAAGDRDALCAAVENVRDMVFNLSLRMLGGFEDAEDASQEILMKVVSGISGFRGESAFATWVFAIARNHLVNYRRHMFAKLPPLTFEYYGSDIKNADIESVPDLTGDTERHILAEELKMSCTNVMLQCLDPESRCIFILGTMFRADSRVAGEILGITPEAYRSRLSRVRRKMADFLAEYCGEYGNGQCRCADRINYAIQNHRISPEHRDFTAAREICPETMVSVKRAMEDIDGISQEFSFCRTYQSPERLREFIMNFLSGADIETVRKG